MYNIFLDTNLFLDHLLQRNPFSTQVLQQCEKLTVKGYASSASFYTLAYLVEKNLSKKEARNTIRGYSDFIITIPTTHNNLLSALSSNFSDLEDGFQYYTAMNEMGMDYFLTNNLKDFKDAKKLAVISAMEFLKIVKK